MIEKHTSKKRNQKKVITGALLAPIAVSMAANEYKEASAETEIIEVHTVEDFINMKNNPSATYQLANDIDLSGVHWTPFVFTGTLDANGHKIKNLTLSRNNSYVGLFSRINGGQVKNLIIENFEVSGTDFVGSLAGEITNGGYVENVQVYNSSVKGLDYVGLLSGNIYHSTVKRISAEGMAEGRNYVGGLIGRAHVYSGINTIENVYTNGVVKGTNQIGGIIGQTLTSYSGRTDVTNAYSTASVEGQSYIGGILGQNYCHTNFTNVYALNNHIQGSGINVGKVIGYADRSFTPNNLTAHERLRGNGGSQYVQNVITQEQLEEGLAGFEDETIWKQDQTTKLPILVQQTALAGEAPTYNEKATIVPGKNGFYDPIYTVQDLQAIPTNNIKGLSQYKIMNDLDFTGVEWNPYPLLATIEGGGHTLSNLTVIKNSNYTGLFSQINGGQITDIVIKDFSVDGTHFVGALSGEIVNGGYVENVQVYNSSVKGLDYVGLLSGNIYHSTVKRISTEGTAEGRNYVGGLIGRAHVYSGINTIENVYTNGIVKGTNQIGGIIGQTLTSYSGRTDVTNAYSTASVEGQSYIGGISGQNYCHTNFTNVYALNNHIQGSGTNVGKVIGYADRSFTPNNLTAHERLRGNGGSQYVQNVITQEQLKEGLDGFEDTSIWKQDETTRLPIFTNQESFVGEIPTYETRPTVLMDEKGVFHPIYSVDDLQNVKTNNVKGLSRYKIMNDLDFAGYDWQPFDLAANIEGNGKTLKNLTFSAETRDFVGLFSQITGKISDIKIENFNITGRNYVGTLVGRLHDFGEIENVEIVNSSVKGNDIVGLLAGEIYHATVKKISTEGSVEGRNAIGGLIGQTYTYRSSNTIENVYSNGTVKGNDMIGGLIGYNLTGIDGHTNVTNAYTTTSVEGNNSVGGFIGKNHSYGTFTNVYSLNSLVQGHSNVGKSIGYASRSFDSDSLAVHEGLKGNAGSQYVNRTVSSSEIESGLSGFENTEIWKQDSETKLPIFIHQTSFVGAVPTFETRPTVLMDENGVFNPIYSVEDLQNVKTNNVKGLSRYKIMNDLDFTGYDWQPFDLEASIDGNGITLRNLTLEKENADYVGLFSQITGEIKNIQIENFNVTGRNYVGTLTGRIHDFGKVENIQIANSSVKGNDVVGLLSGEIYHATANEISTEGSVEGRNAVGGVFGQTYTYRSSNAIENIYSNGAVKGTNYVGGLIGYNLTGIDGHTNVTNAYTTTTVEGENYVGGLIGRNNSYGTFTNVYALNNLVQATRIHAGKAIGYADRSFSSSTLTVHEGMKGNAGSQYVNQTISQSEVEDGMVGFEDEAIWKQDKATKLPIFLNQESFIGEIPTYETRPTVLMDENGIYNPIYSVEDLQNVKTNNVRGLSRYKIMNDLDFTGYDWQPFALSASIDGNGMTLRNLTLEKENADYVGLFSQINGEIKNIHIENFEVTGRNYVGAFAGLIHDFGQVENITVKDSTVNGTDFVGLLTGEIYHGTLKKVSTVGTVQGRNYVGGVIGSSRTYRSTNTIENIYSNGVVKGNNEIGGLIGKISTNIDGRTYVTNAYTTATVEGNSYIGGLIGRNTSFANLTNLYALNNLIQGNGSRVGKAIGHSDREIISSTLTVHERLKGNGGSQYVDQIITQSEVENGMVGFEDKNIWKQDEATKLPIFVEQPSFHGAVPTYSDWATIVGDETGFYNPIYTVEDLQGIPTNNLRGQDRYKIMNDLDFTGYDWKPFTLAAYVDANHKTLKNLTYSNPNGDYVGLFDQITGEFENATIENFDITGRNYVGSFAGIIHDGGFVENIHVKDSSVKGTDFVGLLAGEIYHGTLKKASTVGTVEGRNYVGGVIGSSHTYRSTNTIENVYSSGQVKGNNEVGGIAGKFSTSIDGRTHITNAYTTASVEGNSFIGGILGKNTSFATFTNVYALNNYVQGSVGSVGKAVGFSDRSIDSITLTVHEGIRSNGGTQYVEQVITQEQIEQGLTGFEDESVWKQDETTFLPIFIEQDSFEGNVATYSERPTSLVENGTIYTAVYDVNDLQNIGKAPNSNYSLQNDLDLSDVDFTPISALSGIFKGNNHIIEHLTITNPTYSNVGLFRTVNGSIYDLHVQNAKITSNQGIVGILAGTLHDATIDNVSVSGEVKGFNNIGGVAGIITSSNLNEVYSQVKVEGNAYIGGIAGTNNHSTLSNIYSSGNVTGKAQYTGGLIGYNQHGTINKAYSSALVDGDTSVGGLIGYNQYGTLENSFALNPYIEGRNQAGANIGRTIGYNQGGTFANVYAHETMIGNLDHENYYTDTITDQQAREKVTFSSLASFDMENVWGIKEGESFPYLKTLGSEAWDDGNRYSAPFDPIVSVEHVSVTKLELSWTPVNTADYYIIKREGEEVGRTTETSFTDSGLTKNTLYQYEVIAVNEYGESEPAQFSVRTIDIPKARNLTAEKVGYNELTLSWDVFGEEVDEFIITRNGEEIARIPYDPATETYKYKDKNLTNGTEYQYQVFVVYEGDISTPTTIKPKTLTVPKANVNVKKAKDVSLELAWEPIDIATEYIIYRDGEQIARVSEPEYLDEGLTPSTSYKYEIITVSEYGNSQPSKITAGTTDVMHSVTLSWFEIEGAVEYQIQRDGTLIGETKETTFTDHEAIVGRNYRYRIIPVFADGTKGEGAFYDVHVLNDNEFTIVLSNTNDELPSTGVYHIGEEKAYIQWPHIANASSYNIYRNGKKISTILINHEGDIPSYLSFKDSEDFDPLLADEYEYKVEAMSASGFSLGFLSPQEVENLPLPVITTPEEEHVVFEWEPIVGAAKYLVKRDGKVVHEQMEDGSPIYRYIDETLDPAKRYHFQLVALKADGTPIGEPIDIGFHQLGGNLVAFSSPTIEFRVNNDELVVSWDYFEEELGVEVPRYRVEKEVKNENGEYEREGIAVSTDEKSYTFTALKDHTDYRFTVIPFVNGFYDRSHAIQKEITTPEFVRTDEKPSIVLNVAAALTDKNGEVLVTWDPFSLEGIESTRYRVQRYIKQEDGTFIKDGFARTTSTNQLLSSNLKIGAEYYYQVTPMVNNSYKEEYAGISNHIIVEKTEEEANTSVVNVSASVNGIVAEVRWEPFIHEGEPSTRYRVQTYVQDEETGEFIKEGIAVSVNGYSRQITNLEEGKTYRFTVIPLVNGKYDDTFAGTSNEVTTQVTPIPEPEPAPTYEVRATVDGTTVTLDWDSIEGVTRYRVEKYKLNEDTGLYERQGFGIATSETTFTLENLDPNSEYKFVVTPRIGYVYDNKASMETTATIGAIEEEVVEPKQFEGVYVIMNDDKAIIHWEPMILNGEKVTRYRVQRYVLDPETGEYKPNHYSPAVDGTSYVDEYYRDGEKYKYEITPLGLNQYLYEWTTTIYNVTEVSEGETKVFFDTTEEIDESKVVFEVQRFVKNEENGEFEKMGEPFEVIGTEFTDTEAVEGKEYKYAIKVKSIPLR
jgi:M26 IgA1-specific Metallo-endopeptidase N-terminal region/Fibronectin type III domain